VLVVVIAYLRRCYEQLASKCSCFCFGWKLLSREFLLWLIRQRLPKACNDVSLKLLAMMELMKKNNQWGEEEIATHEAEMLAVLTSARILAVANKAEVAEGVQ
jgi:hypothetical protein